MKTPAKRQLKIRQLLVLFIICLVLSGLTAFPLEWEMGLAKSIAANFPPVLKQWYETVSQGLSDTEGRYPFIAYGTDWLGFSHIVIALFFIAPLKEPLKYKLIIEIGIVACLLVFPLAIGCGALRGIPFFWRMIDCSFGLFGGILLYAIRREIILLESFHSITLNTEAHEKK